MSLCRLRVWTSAHCEHQPGQGSGSGQPRASVSQGLHNWTDLIDGVVEQARQRTIFPAAQDRIQKQEAHKTAGKDQYREPQRYHADLFARSMHLTILMVDV